MAELAAPKGKTTWIIGGVVVLLVLWFLMKRGSGATVIPGTAGGESDAQTAAAAQGFAALAGAVGSIESAREAGRAQLAIVNAEANAAIQTASINARAATAAADRYTSAQTGSYVWGTIRDIGVKALPYLFLNRAGVGTTNV